MEAPLRAPGPGGCRRWPAIACSAVVLVATSAFAQIEPATVTEPESADLPRYTVELIVFAYDEGVPAGNEVFVPDEPLIDFIPEYSDEAPQGRPRVWGDAASTIGEEPLQQAPEAPVEIPGTASVEEAEDPALQEPPVRKWIELSLLPEQDARMNEIHERLVRIDAYHPLMQAAWTQTTPTRRQAPALHLQSLGAAPPGLDGSVTLYAGRYVHLVLDLSLRAAGNAEADAATRRLQRRDDRLQGAWTGDDESSRLGGPVHYRISEDRIMRNGDIRYFDHPKFGVIARVSRAEATVDDGGAEPVETGAGSD